jgi:DNA (cytosine-5)-methyltransferase 1
MAGLNWHGRSVAVEVIGGLVRVGSLFSGYGGLDMAVGGELAWYSEIEPAACKVMEAHYPGVPNLGDITKVDWTAVEPVDVITGGYPCQPFSSAGARKGKNDERHLWPYVRDAIGAIRPRYAVLENVRGHLTLGFADVLADLACLGVSARWGIVRAADAGAPHNRARLFIVADANGKRQEWAGRTRGGWYGSQDDSEPDADTTSAERRAEESADLVSVARAATKLGECFEFDRHSNGDHDASQQPGHWQGTKPTRVGGDDRQGHTSWGPYKPAICRWQNIIGRAAPAPTVERNKRQHLNPVFVEWMMGLPEGHVTGHGLSASQELKMLGNGVVPQQAALALHLLGVTA